MRLFNNIIPLETTRLLSRVFVPICFISCCFHLDLSKFFYFIVIYHKHFSFNLIIMKGLLSICSFIRLFVTNKSEGISIFLLNTDIFNLSIKLEEIYNILFCITVREILDVKVATTLWSFIANSFSKFFSNTISFV